MAARWREHLVRGAVAGVLASLLAGCAVGPNFKTPDAPPVERYTPERLASPRASAEGPRVPRQRFVTSGEISSRWWTVFRSRPLNELIRLSVDHNPTLQAADAAVRVAEFNALVQRGAWMPQVTGNYTPSDQQLSNNATSDPVASPQTRYTLHAATFNVSFVPDIWGGNLRAVENLDALAEQQQFQLEAAYLTLTGNVVAAAIQEASLRGQIAATKRIVKIERDILDILKKQYAFGQSAQVDVLTQEAALAQAEQTLPPLEKQLAVQRDLLTALAGQFSADAILQSFELGRIALPPNLPVVLPSTMVRQRPDVRAAEAFLHAASAQVGVTVAARLPNINLSANGGAAAFKAAELFTPGTAFYVVAASATQTIFDGMALYNKQRAAEAALDQAGAIYRQAVITAFQNVADALRAVQADARTVQAAVKSETAARAALDVIQKQLSLGQVNQVVVLNAQQTYFNASIARVQAEAVRLADSAALFVALGGGWPESCKGPDWRRCVSGEPGVEAAAR